MLTLCCNSSGNVYPFLKIISNIRKKSKYQIEHTSPRVLGQGGPRGSQNNTGYRHCSWFSVLTVKTPQILKKGSREVKLALAWKLCSWWLAFIVEEDAIQADEEGTSSMTFLHDLNLQNNPFLSWVVFITTCLVQENSSMGCGHVCK